MKSAPSSSSNKSNTSSNSAPPLPSIRPPPQTAAPTNAVQSSPTAATINVAPAKATPAPPKPTPPQPLPSTLVELEKSLDVAVQTAAKEYQNAINVLQQYNEDVKLVVDRIIENSDNTIWTTLKNKTSARDTAVEAAERTAQEARSTIGNLLNKIFV